MAYNSRDVGRLPIPRVDLAEQSGTNRKKSWQESISHHLLVKHSDSVAQQAKAGRTEGGVYEK